MIEQKLMTKDDVSTNVLSRVTTLTLFLHLDTNLANAAERRRDATSRDVADARRFNILFFIISASVRHTVTESLFSNAWITIKLSIVSHKLRLHQSNILFVFIATA